MNKHPPSVCPFVSFFSLQLKFSYYLAASQTIWISDGCHSVHMFTMDMENALNVADVNVNGDGDENLMHLQGLHTSLYIIGYYLLNHILPILEVTVHVSNVYGLV